MKPLILIVEDEPAQAEMLRYNLEHDGYRTLSTASGEEALLMVRESVPDLVVLDWMLPDRSGVEICHRLREAKDTRPIPVIIVTARGEEVDRVRGLDAGADDYVVKPFSPNEMIARVRAVLRRTRPALAAETLEYGGLVMNLASHKVSRDEKPLRLSPTEFRLLRILIERPGRVFTREALLDMVWGREVYLEARTVDVHVGRLRKALDVGGGDLIRTVRGVGYALDRDAG